MQESTTILNKNFLRLLKFITLLLVSLFGLTQDGSAIGQFAQLSIEPVSNSSQGLPNPFMVRDINSSPSGSSHPNGFFPLNGRLLFSAEDDFNSGNDLWESDGSLNNTNKVADLNLNTVGDIRIETFFQNWVFFTDNDTWIQTDGSTSGTLPFNVPPPGQELGYFTIMNDYLFFTATTCGYPPSCNDYALYRSEGTAANVVQLLNLPGSGYIGQLVALNNQILFIADDGISGGELWRSDGTSTGTFMVKDINPGPGDSLGFLRSVTMGNEIFFAAYQSNTGHGLWKSDGTAAGTTLVKELNTPYGLSIASSNDYIYLFVTKDQIGGTWILELWRSDGTEAGTIILSTMNVGGGEVYHFVEHNGFVIFNLTTGQNMSELWRSDGTPAGTYMFKELNYEDTFSQPWNFVPTDDFVYFTSGDGSNGDELWRTDGTGAGTFMIADINSGPEGSHPDNLLPAFPPQQGSSIFFTADDGQNGEELWYSDGTESGTYMIYDINPGPANSSPDLLKNITLSQKGIWLFFSAYDGQNGVELWTLPHTNFTDHSYLPLVP